MIVTTVTALDVPSENNSLPADDGGSRQRQDYVVNVTA